MTGLQVHLQMQTLPRIYSDRSYPPPTESKSLHTQASVFAHNENNLEKKSRKQSAKWHVLPGKQCRYCDWRPPKTGVASTCDMTEFRPYGGQNNSFLGAVFMDPSRKSRLLHVGCAGKPESQTFPKGQTVPSPRISANYKSIHLGRPESSTTSHPTLRARTTNIPFPGHSAFPSH